MTPEHDPESAAPRTCAQAYAPTIGEAIRCVRETCGYSQEFLADLLGCARNSLVNWETGRTTPTVLVLDRLREVTGRDAYLLARGETPLTDADPESAARRAMETAEALVRRVLAVVAGPVRITPSLAGQDRIHWSVEYQRFIRTAAGTTELAWSAVFAWSQADALRFVLAKEAERDAALLAHLKAREEAPRE